MYEYDDPLEFEIERLKNEAGSFVFLNLYVLPLNVFVLGHKCTSIGIIMVSIFFVFGFFGF